MEQVAKFHYNAARDGIEIVSDGGNVRAFIPRNAVIKMVGMLAPNPPPVRDAVTAGPPALTRAALKQENPSK